ncbi:MAG: hypothetical protein JOZ53_04835 [Planctomycetaceae bacterium]|nr:hypothetical protein [Planctomycetaceae bacterium]
MVIRSDTLSRSEPRRVYTLSRNVADRIRVFNGLEPDGVLYPPLLNNHPFRPGPFGDDSVYVSRLCPHQRQDLAIEAVRYVWSDCRLVIVGVPVAPGYDGSPPGSRSGAWASRGPRRDDRLGRHVVGGRAAGRLPRGAVPGLRRGLRGRDPRGAALRQAHHHRNCSLGMC